jgi:hypothetical protein
MPRPLRIQGSGYHVTARGNERRAIFRDDRDRRHFLELLAELPGRFGTRLHGWVHGQSFSSIDGNARTELESNRAVAKRFLQRVV